jgi:hypothetical protein
VPHIRFAPPRTGFESPLAPIESHSWSLNRTKRDLQCLTSALRRLAQALNRPPSPSLSRWFAFQRFFEVLHVPFFLAAHYHKEYGENDVEPSVGVSYVSTKHARTLEQRCFETRALVELEA